LPDKVRIRPLDAFEEFVTLLDIQRSVWKHDESDLTPTHQFRVSSRMGAILLGAFVGRKLAGFVYSFPAVFDGVDCQHSHLLAVLPEFQGSGLGKALKWAQRAEALKRGYDLITWTFDPLQTRNANLNLQSLAAVSRTYLGNFYGMTPSLCLGPGIPTDRLLIEWPLRDRRVRDVAAGRAKRPCYDVTSLPKALERKAGEEGSFASPGKLRLRLQADTVLVEIPRDVKALAFRCDLIAAWQAGLRRAMSLYFGHGYAAEHFVYGDRSFYVLKRRKKR
jgi:predicted GNAT superfamily acetyltransferase